MKQEIAVRNRVDANGNPAGGHVLGTGILIDWQNGPLSVDGVRRGPNGAFVEGVIEAAKQRLEHYQESKFRCSENELAIQHLEAALEWLQSRTTDREARNVEGTHEV